MRFPRRQRASSRDVQKTVTVQVFCHEGDPPYTVLWEPTGDEFIVETGDRYTFTFEGRQFRKDWTDIAVGVGPHGLYLGGENLNQRRVTKNGQVVWT